jgi:hypothetical protein
MMEASRRDFRLPEADEEFLVRLGLRWEAISERNRRWLVIYDFPLPPGFTVSFADTAIEILAGYPPGPLDMAYFVPALQRSDGKPIPQTQAVEQIAGKSWQRWSRHRTGDCPWMAGEDSLETHIDFVRGFLDREPKR